MPELITQPGELDLLAVHQNDPERFPFLLESRVINDKIGRYSLLLGDCTQNLSASTAAELEHCLQQIEQTPAVEPLNSQLPFSGGWLVYLAYETARHWQTGLKTSPHDSMPVLRAAYCPSAIVVDHIGQQTFFVSRDKQAQDLVAISRQLMDTNQGLPPLALMASDFQEDEPARFRHHVERVIEYILAGDIYQANISRRWSGPRISKHEFHSLYSLLRTHNPASFAASCIWPDYAIASASPERLFRVQDRVIDTRPIAGTRPRMSDAAADSAKRRELKANPKEQAEHIMLVDLERNDLGRVAEPGSVEVDELLIIESYASVHHLVSNIKACLQPQARLSDILKAVFPGGTITGCPKLRCMQIIAELEQRPRGAYTGSLGYVSDCGRMDFNILIRSIVSLHGQLQLDAGAGIVADSIPEKELQETRAKASGVLTALSAKP